MSGQKWIKLWVDFLENDKILSIFSGEFLPKMSGKTDEFCPKNGRILSEKLPKSSRLSDKKRDRIVLIWLQLLCLAGKINRGGVLAVSDDMPYTPRLIAEKLHRAPADVRTALEVFSYYGMIEDKDGFIAIKNWSKYQGSEAEDRKREYNRERTAAIRQKEREQYRQKGDNSCQPKTTTERQQLSAQKKDIYIRETSTSPYVDVEAKRSDDVVVDDGDDGGDGETGFIPPTVEQVRTVCRERKLKVDPARFVDYYTQRRWQGVTDWKAKLMSWEANACDDERKRKSKARDKTGRSFETDDAFDAALMRSYGDDPELMEYLREARGGGSDGQVV